MNHKPQKSQTTPILYQEPTQAEMHPSFIQKVASKFQTATLVSIITVSFIFTSLTVMRGCADDVERQHAMAVKHQIQFGVAQKSP